MPEEQLENRLQFGCLNEGFYVVWAFFFTWLLYLQAAFGGFTFYCKRAGAFLIFFCFESQVLLV